MNKSCFIDGRWVDGEGVEIVDVDPTNGAVLWSGRGATEAQVDRALQSATKAFESWRLHDGEQRLVILRRYADLIARDKENFATLIARETGKPRWECLAEVGAMVAKVRVSANALSQRCGEQVLEIEGADFVGRKRYKPHGPVVVFAPYNLPGHLPNGHFVPALLAGNTIVLKPSEQTPQSGIFMVERLLEAGLPSGCIQLLQGGRETGVALSSHPAIRGLFFTGSSGVGRAIHRALAGRVEVICALEMGGNNPLVVWRPDDVQAAAVHVVLSAFITSGQRCTCARRLIVPDDADGDALIEAVCARIGELHIGPWDDDPQPFFGPLISEGAANAMVQAWQDLVARGGQPIVELGRLPLSPAALSPGLIDVTAIDAVPDEEIFGPVLQVIRVADFEAALKTANATQFGLSAALIGGSRQDFERFHSSVEAGICNWNRPTTGALSSLPFGGSGSSGNHRPAGWHSVDYCAWPVAATESEHCTIPATLPPGISTATAT